MKVGIDLLWIRPGKNGGTESYIRNLLDGFLQTLEEDMELYLFVSEDNEDSFNKYYNKKNIKRVSCKVKSANVGKRILWQNIFMNWTRRQKPGAGRSPGAPVWDRRKSCGPWGSWSISLKTTGPCWVPPRWPPI